jgi:hypothetical protein
MNCQDAGSCPCARIRPAPIAPFIFIAATGAARREFRRTADPMRKLATTPMAASRGTRLPSVNRHVKLRPTGDWAPQRLGAAGAEWPPQARVPA